ncbi:hypothetical protein Pint_06229 [Pistacia integerrima]|uniref:Uncharacterized protein n=1 Tax=Pistacia integerrima TaxID=434235 RepID=A0ACC0Z478_9ROSI|nr:hypothetical protein Pint_06229 [Pistacia integerrima]
MDLIQVEIWLLETLYGITFESEAIFLAARIASHPKNSVLSGEIATFFYILEESCKRKDLNDNGCLVSGLHDAETERTQDDSQILNIHIGVTEIAEIASELTGIPASWFVINKPEQRYKKLKDSIMNSPLVPKVDGNCLGRPLGLFLLVGCNGAGKSELAEAIAKELFDDEDSFFIRIGMEEYTEPYSVSCLVDKLLDTVKNKKPYSVVVLDKIDKVDSSVMDTLVNVLINPGNAFDFRQALIILTCDVEDLDMEELRLGSVLGKEYEEAAAFIKPELLDLVDKMILVDTS